MVSNRFLTGYQQFFNDVDTSVLYSASGRWLNCCMEWVWNTTVNDTMLPSVCYTIFILALTPAHPNHINHCIAHGW